LATLPANTASSAHSITLKVSNDGEFDIIKTALNGASNKYVKLDLSGNTLTAIPDFAFYDYIFMRGCATLTGITIPSGVTSIGGMAFYNCSYLQSVTLPNSVTNIKESAFLWCVNLTSVTLPDSVTSIGVQAFSSTGLVSVTFIGTIPSSGFRWYDSFDGDLRSKFYATNSSSGTPGTYTRPSASSTTWTRIN
jgi:hypothetical protein